MKVKERIWLKIKIVYKKEIYNKYNKLIFIIFI